MFYGVLQLVHLECRYTSCRTIAFSKLTFWLFQKSKATKKKPKRNEMKTISGIVCVFDLDVRCAHRVYSSRRIDYERFNRAKYQYLWWILNGLFIILLFFFFFGYCVFLILHRVQSTLHTWELYRFTFCWPQLSQSTRREKKKQFSIVNIDIDKRVNGKDWVQTRIIQPLHVPFVAKVNHDKFSVIFCSFNFT